MGKTRGSKISRKKCGHQVTNFAGESGRSRRSTRQIELSGNQITNDLCCTGSSKALVT